MKSILVWSLSQHFSLFSCITLSRNNQKNLKKQKSQFRVNGRKKDNKGNHFEAKSLILLLMSSGRRFGFSLLQEIIMYYLLITTGS